MKTPTPTHSPAPALRSAAAFSFTFGVAFALILAVPTPTQAAQPWNPLGPQDALLNALQTNRHSQLQAAQSWQTFHSFQFSDQYDSSGIRFQHQPVEDASKHYKAVHYDHGNGIAAADVDGDGLIDLYFVNQLGSSQLWRNRGQGKFENITEQAGVGLADKISVAASFADIDNDGRPDLLVTSVRQGNTLFHNLGGGKFQDITESSGLRSTRQLHASGATFFDFNKDGLLDLFIANVGSYTRNEKGPGGFYLARPDAFQGWQFPSRSETSALYQNLGGGKFQDVSQKTGLVHQGWSGDATFCDLNQDGYPDLYVLSMSGDDKFYENERGERFIEKTAAYFPKTPWGSMGVKFFDYNLDGLPDLYITDMHSDMTSAQIKAGDTDFSSGFDKQKSDVWCSAEWSPAALQAATNNILGNAFYQNQGNGSFREVSNQIGTETYWPWGMTVADLNADGYEDIFVTAGMGYPLRYSINSVLLNENGKRFVDSEYVLGVEPRLNNRIEKEFFTLDTSGADQRHPLSKNKSGTLSILGSTSSRSSVAFDLDDDGDLDLVTNEWSDHPMVLISNLSEKRKIHFAKIKLVGRSQPAGSSNRDALGAIVQVYAGGKSYWRYNDGKSGYLSQSSMPLYFGLGTDSQIERIEVTWPSGKKQTYKDNLSANALITLTESP